MKKNQIVKNKVVNFIHTLLLFSLLLVLMVLTGYLLAGGAGLIWAGFIGIFSLIATSGISPHIILKMYKARPLSVAEAGGLYAIVHELAKRANLPKIPELYYIPTRNLNAFSVGRQNNSAIGITDGLLRSLDMREVSAVLAHEISHIRSNDMRVMGIADIISRITGFFSTVGQLLLLFNFPLIVVGSLAISWTAIFILIFAPVLSGLLQLAISRTREFNADLDAARLTGDPEGLIVALKKMDYKQSGFFRRILLPGRNDPNPSLLRTHPRTEERIERLRQLSEERYQPFFTDNYGSLISRDFPPEVLNRPRWRRFSGLWY